MCEHATEAAAKILDIFKHQQTLGKHSEASYYSKCEKTQRRCWEIESNPARDRWLCGSCEKWYHTGLMSTLTNTAFWGECGASWLPTPYREKGPLMLSPCWETSFLLLEPQKKISCGAFQNQSSEDIKLTFSQSDDEKLNNRLHVNHFYAAALSHFTCACKSRYF